jgi:integrase
MASIYQRPDSQNYHLSCYPRPGAKLVRASLGTENQAEAEKVARTVELLIELEKYSDTKVPAKVLDSLPGVRSMIGSCTEAVVVTSVTETIIETKEDPIPKCSINKAIRSMIMRSLASTAYHATDDKVSKFRQFFGPDRINAIDPRPEDILSRRRKVKGAKPWYQEKDEEGMVKDPEAERTYYPSDNLSDITAEEILEFLLFKKYGSSSKRHFRELFHQLFQVALKSGIYVPDNPYAPNPADELPTFKGKDEPITLLTSDDEDNQYAAVEGSPLIKFGCQLMLEGGFRLHEILALKRSDLDLQRGKICLHMPKKERVNSTGLKTGERTVTMRRPLRRMIEEYFEAFPGHPSEWIFLSSPDERMQSDEFGRLLKEMNSKAGLPWTTQDFRHTFATNRIAEGWNMKVIAQEMGTSIYMLMQHYAGYIEPPVCASLNGA